MNSRQALFYVLAISCKMRKQIFYDLILLDLKKTLWPLFIDGVQLPQG